MNKANLKSRLFSIIVGSALVLGSIWCVLFIKKSVFTPEGPPVIRPLKTTVIKSKYVETGAKYPGKVKANESVNLAFQVDGPILEKAVKKGEVVKKGQVLMKLDPRDYENSLAAAVSEYEKADVYLKRIEKAVKSGAVSETDLTNAQTEYETALANKNIAEKALEDTVIYAKFDGVIANTFVEKFQNVEAKEIVLSLQDSAHVEVEINVPEEHIAMSGKKDTISKSVAVFDYLPDKEFELELKEYATEADTLTQTYLVTFVMPSPKEAVILPGMTATVIVYRKATAQAKTEGFYIPIEAAVIDETEQYYVWKVDQAEEEGLYAVKRLDIEVGEVTDDGIVVTKGLEVDDRIATAGVHFLQEEQKVYLYDEKAQEDEK